MTELARGQQYPKRFYKEVSLETIESDGYVIQLDGRVAKTPHRHALTMSSKKLGQAVAEEWMSAVDVVDTSKMPLTKFQITLIDLGDAEKANWAKLVLEYFGSDLLCYRASRPASLVAREDELWGGFQQFWEKISKTALVTTIGLSAITQPSGAVQFLESYCENCSAQKLLVLKIATEISGSAILGLSLVEKFDRPDAIFAASRLHEQFQVEKWGQDDEAKQKETALKFDFDAVSKFYDLNLSD